MPLSLFSHQAPSAQLFLGLLVADDSIKAVLWSVEQGQVSVVRQSSAHPYTQDKEAVVAADAGLQELGKESENVSEVVFGLEPNWVTEAGIAEERKPLLKHLTQELSLKAIGFVANNEAWVQHTRDVQPNVEVVCVYVTTQEVLLATIHQGKIGLQEKVNRSDDVVMDVVEAIARLGGGEGQSPVTHMPLKWLLASLALDDTELVGLHQRLSSFDWSDKPQVPQEPSVQLIPQLHLVPAIIEKAGQAVAQAKGLAAQAPASTSSSAAEFGFSQVTESTAPKSFGIPIMSHHSQPSAPDAFDQKPPAKWSPLPSGRRTTGKSKLVIPILAGFAGGLVVLGLAAFIWWQQTARAVVKVMFAPKPIVETVELTLDPTLKQSQADQKRVAATLVTKSVTGEATGASTGVKLVGDSAKGTITIINKTDSSKNFPGGTVISSGTLKFNLGESVTVPAASVSAQNSDSQTKTFGKADVQVVAAKIGDESNLKKDTQFKVADFADSSYAAIAKTDFSGGSSREVKVVTDKDRQKITQELTAKLLKEAETALKKDIPTGRSLILTGNQKTEKAEFDAKTGDETETVTLQLSLAVEAFTYDNAELKPLSQAILAPHVPAGYELGSEAPGILSSPTNTASGSSAVVIKAEISAQAYPQFNAEDWQREIAGKPIKTAQSLLQAKTDVKGVEVFLQPTILQKLLPRLPMKPEQIEIQRQSRL